MLPTIPQELDSTPTQVFSRSGLDAALRRVAQLKWRFRLWMAMKDVRGDVRPELPKHIRQHISPDGPSIFRGHRSGSPRTAGVVRQRDTLRDAPAENFRSVEAVVSVIIGRDQNAGGCIDSALPNSALPHCIVALVLMEDGR